MVYVIVNCEESETEGLTGESFIQRNAIISYHIISYRIIDNRSCLVTFSVDPVTGKIIHTGTVILLRYVLKGKV